MSLDSTIHFVSFDWGSRMVWCGVRWLFLLLALWPFQAIWKIWLCEQGGATGALHTFKIRQGYLSFCLCSNLFREGLDDIENSLANLFFLQFWGSCWGFAGVQHNVATYDLRPAKTFRMKWKTCSHSDGSWSRGDVSDRFECWRVKGFQGEKLKDRWPWGLKVDWCLIDV